jgi:hypothetical protein
MLFPLALLAALVVGAATAYFAREMRPSFYDGRALRDATGLPLLGVVSQILTDEARDARRRGTLRFMGGVGALVGCYLSAAIAFHILVKSGAHG